MTDFQASLAQLRKEHYWDQLPIQPDVDEKGIDDGEDFKCAPAWAGVDRFCIL